MRAAIYARISADVDGEGIGVDRQLAACKSLAKKLKHRVTDTYTDNDVSAYSGKTRPGFEKMLTSMDRAEFDVLVVWHMDRLYRSMKDLERIIDAAESGGVQIQTVESGDFDLSTAAGKMVARILGSVARQESEHHAERRREANKGRALKGEWRREGSRPFGYDNTGIPVEPEASMIRQATSDVLAGKSLQSVAREWNTSGVTTVRGVAWTNLHVRRVLTNPRVAAQCVYQGNVVSPGNWEPIVPETTWRGLVAFLSNPSRKNAVAFERRYLLSGIARCGTCDSVLYGAYPHGRDRAMLYVCKNGSHVGRKAADLDEFVELAILAYLGEQGLGSALQQHETRIDLTALRVERNALAESKDQLATLLRKRVLDVAGVEREALILTEQIAEIDRKMSASVTVHPLVAILAGDDEDPATVDLEALVDRWIRASVDRKGKAIKSLLEVKVNRTARGERVFNHKAIELIWK